MTAKPRIFRVSFASVYPLYIAKAVKKGRTKEDVDSVIRWLTGYDSRSLKAQIDAKKDFETFFGQAPKLNPNMYLVTGLICGIRVENIQDETMRLIRILDKLVDELAKGKSMDKILRQ